MANRLYHDPRINIENVATDLEHTFLSQGYQVQHFGNSDHMTVQMRKGGDFATIVGMQTALTVHNATFTTRNTHHGWPPAMGRQSSRWSSRPGSFTNPLATHGHRWHWSNSASQS